MAILITGVSGFLGRHFLMNLLLSEEREAGSIVGLVRKTKKNSPAELMEQLISRTALHCGKSSGDIQRLVSRMKHACQWVEGDVSEQFLGVPPETWNQFEIREIWHLAALLRFENYKKKEVFRVNVHGTENALKLARDKKIECFHFISTVYVAGTKQGEIAEEPFDLHFETNNPYEESKRLGENLVASYARRGNFSYRIYRSGVMMPHRNAIKNESHLAMGNYFKLFIEFREHILERMPGYFDQNALTILVEKGSAVSCIYVDHLCESIRRIASQPESTNKIFHVTGHNMLNRAGYNRLVARFAGIQVKHTTDPLNLNDIDRLFLCYMEAFCCYCHNRKTFLTTRASDYGVKPYQSSFTKNDATRMARLFVDQYHEEKERHLRKASSAFGAFSKKTVISPMEDLSYYAGGNGKEILVLLNAYGQSFSLWNFLLLKLKKHYRIIFWQPRGSASLLGGIEKHYPIEKHIEDLSNILKSEKVAQCTILAWHTGPKLAVELYRQNPALVSDMIFLSPSFKGTVLPKSTLTQKDEGIYEKNAEMIFKIINAEPKAATRVISSLKTLLVGKNIQLKKFLPGDETVNILSMINRSLKPVILEPFLSTDRVIQYARQLLAFWSYDISKQIDEIDIPVLLIWGEYDNIISTNMAYHAGSMIKGAKLLMLKGATHFPQYESSELLYDIINKFHKEKEDFSFHDNRVVAIK